MNRQDLQTIRSPKDARWQFPVTALVIAIGVSVLWLNNASWTVTQSGWLDPWIYVNYFTDFPGRGVWPEYYKASRIPWNSLGATVVGTFGLSTGQAVLAAISIALLGTASFFALRNVSLPAAIAATAITTLTPWFHGNGGWLYQNSLAGPLQAGATLIALSLLLRPRSTRLRALPTGGLADYHARVALLGLVVTLLAITNTMQVMVVAPAIVTLALTRRHRRSARRFLSSSVAFLVGVATGLMSCSAMSLLLGWRADFWAPLTRTFNSFSDGSFDVWWEPLSSRWWESQPYLGLIIASAFLPGALLLASRARRTAPPTRSQYGAHLLVMWHIASVTIWVATYLLLEFPLLNWSYHSYPLLISGAFAVSAIVTQETRARTFGTGAVSLVTVSSLAAVLPLLGSEAIQRAVSGIPLVDERSTLFIGFAAMLMWAIAGLTIKASTTPYRTQGRAAFVLSGMALVVLGFSIPGSLHYGVLYSESRCSSVLEGNAAILASVKAVQGIDSPVAVRIAGQEGELLAGGVRHDRLIFSSPDDPACTLDAAGIAASLGQIYPFTLEQEGSPQYQFVIQSAGQGIPATAQGEKWTHLKSYELEPYSRRLEGVLLARN